jgi:acetyl esterase/lipase
VLLVLAAALVAACGGDSSQAPARDKAPVRKGRPGVTVSPLGTPLGAQDGHRTPGADMAPPLIRGPIDDPSVPVVLYIHGGAWFLTGAAYTRHPAVDRWARAGVAVWSTDYRRDYDSLPDVEYAYRRLRERVGAGRRVCAHGDSAGGQLALMLAARFRSVRCVISNSGAIDLRAMPRGSMLEFQVRHWLLPFGGLRRWDPLTNAKRIRQPVLLIAHTGDPVVPVRQSRRVGRVLPRSLYIELPPGPEGGPASYHGPATTVRADRRAWAAMRRLVLHGRLR